MSNNRTWAVKKQLREWKKQIKKHGKIDCWICTNPIELNNNFGLGNLTLDHVIPLSFQGPNKRSNFRPAHLMCNRYRSNHLLYVISVRHRAKISAYEQASQRTLKLQKALL